jgi:hypothetical protein
MRSTLRVRKKLISKYDLFEQNNKLLINQILLNDKLITLRNNRL